jgi:hypothetical protein
MLTQVTDARQPSCTFALSPPWRIRIPKEHSMRDRIIITEPDHDKLRRLLAGRRGSGANADHLRELEEGLENG